MQSGASRNLRELDELLTGIVAVLDAEAVALRDGAGTAGLSLALEVVMAVSALLDTQDEVRKAANRA